MSTQETNIDKLTVVQLKEQLKQRGCCTQGNKTDLVERLSEIMYKNDHQSDNIDKTKTRLKKGESDGDDISVFVDPEDSASQIATSRLSKTSESSSLRRIVAAKAGLIAKQKKIDELNRWNLQQKESDRRRMEMEQEEELRRVEMEQEEERRRMEEERRRMEMEQDKERRRVKIQQENERKQWEMELRQVEMEQKKERIILEAQIAELEAKEEVLSTIGSRVSRTKKFNSNLTNGMNQYFEDAGVVKRTINKVDNDARLIEVTDDKEKNKRIRSWVETGAYQKNEQYLNQSQEKEEDKYYSQSREGQSWNKKVKDFAYKQDNKRQSYVSRDEEYCRPVLSKQEDSDKIGKLLETLVSFNIRNLVPNQEVEIFKGELTKYQTFIKSFENVISSKLKDDDEKLHYLVQYTSGKPRDIIEACLHMETDKGYKEARLLLEKRYGNSAVIATAYVNKILNWDQVKRDDVEGLDEFAIMLGSCKNAVSQVP